MSLKPFILTISIVFLCTATISHAKEPSESIVSKSDSPCPASYNGFKEGEASSKDIKSCLGKPTHEDYNDDGRYVFVYMISDTEAYTYLFKSDGTLSALRTWKK